MFNQNQFRVRFRSYLYQKNPDITIQIKTSNNDNVPEPIRMGHYYHDAWWYSPSIFSMGGRPPTIVNNYYMSGNQHSDVSDDPEKKKEEKSNVNLEDILKGVFVGGVLIGSSYVVFNSYLDWYDEKCLLKDIESYKESENLDEQNLYSLGKHVLENNCAYSRDMFLTKFGLIGSACLLLVDYNYWDNRTVMNACLVGGGLVGLYGMVKYTLFHRYHNDAHTKACYQSLKEIMSNDAQVHPPPPPRADND